MTPVLAEAWCRWSPRGINVWRLVAAAVAAPSGTKAALPPPLIDDVIAANATLYLTVRRSDSLYLTVRQSCTLCPAVSAAIPAAGDCPLVSRKTGAVCCYRL